MRATDRRLPVSDTTTTGPVWAAIAKLIDPTNVPVERAADADWLAELGDDIFDIKQGKHGVCYVPAYRAACAREAAAQARTAAVPSLWDQATDALTTGSEGGTGTTPLRERSPADLDLMEIRCIIRSTTWHELKTRAKAADHPLPEDVPSQLRRLASIVTRDDAENLDWWEYRFASWARLLEAYLQAAERKPKPVRLRNTPCPLCRSQYVLVEEDGETFRVPPIVIDYRDGHIRAAQCEACSNTWFRGNELGALASLVGAMPKATESAA